MRRMAAGLVSVLAVVLAGCAEVPTETADASTATFKKGGKPGGGGGGSGDGGSPASPEIAFLTSGFDVAVMDADGDNATVLLDRDDFGANLHHPTWSPLGSGTEGDPYSVLFFRYPELAEVSFYVDAGGSVVVLDWELVDTGTAFALDAQYSPDGSLIAFMGSEPSSCGAPGDISRRSLYVMPSDGSASAEEVYCSAAPLGLYGPTWSPDGTAIAFQEEFDDDNLAVIGESAIQICNLGSSGCTIRTAVTRYEADHLHGPDWLNDGSGLLYSSDAGRRGSTFRISLTSIGGLWERTPGSQPEFLFSATQPSSSPDDSQIVVSGLAIYDVATFDKTRGPRGHDPDWRVPTP